MTRLDLLLAAGVLLYALWGYRAGVLRAAVTTLVGGVALLAAWLFPEALTPALKRLGVPAIALGLTSPIAMFLAVDLCIGLPTTLLMWRRQLRQKRAEEEAADAGEEPSPRPGSPLGAVVYAAFACVFALLLVVIAEVQTFHAGLAEHARASWMYRGMIAPTLRDSELPALAPLQLAQELRENPAALEQVRDHDQLAALREYPKLKELSRDPAVRKAAEQKDVEALWEHPGVQALLEDEEFARLLEEIDLKKILDDVRRR